MLDILDYTKQKLISDADFWQFAEEHLDNPVEFKGVSFVSSIKFIEDQLLPRYEKVTLILGLSDNGANSIGKRMMQLTDRNEFVKYGYEHQDSEFTKRILDGSLQLFFTKKELIHTKMYLLTNKDEYLSFAGSMNLTEAAIHQNLEQLDSDYGKQADPLYHCHLQMFNDNFVHAATYLDAKKMTGFIKAKDNEQLQVNVYTDTVNMLENKDKAGQNTIVLPATEIKEYKDAYSSDEALKNLSAKEKLSVAQTVKLFGDAGYKKRNLENIGKELYSLTQVVKHVTRDEDSSGKISREEDLYPKPVLFYNDGQLFEAPRVGDNVKSELLKSNLSGDALRQQLQLFSDIAHEYDNYKEVGEGWQACDFMCFLFEAPWLWKIRNMYEMSPSSKSREDVPLGVALIGQGRTGKSTLGKRLAAKLTGSGNFLDGGIFDAKNYALGKSNINMTITSVLSDYMYSDGPVNPMMIDDISPDLTTRPYFDRFIKEITNNRSLTGPLPSFIFTMNRREGDSKSQFSLKPEIMRRLWYLSFESTFAGNEKEREDKLNDLLGRANDQLYRYCQVELAKFFNNVSHETEQKIEKDYLYPIKHVLKQAMDQFGMFDLVKDYFTDNYDYSLFVGRNDWTMLINQAEVGVDVTFIKQDGELKAQINKQLFNKVSDSTARNNGSMMMERYFQYLPRKYRISYQYTSTGFIVDVNNFDRWLNSDTLRQKYDSSKVALAAQKVNTDAKMTELLTRLTEAQEKQAHRHGIFSWLKKK
ncbi:phospholipase D family protein [Limosilactobacillus sp. RRLNB_1_1]|uniref:Phospholipase D family protein n=1 Tax=Limosilactobacillus albertensis TaxID=2759752 RepID=A0A7W3TS79_9LACO|nr:phospholipase D family protein [Limosilactobacillus albertensis]MBB1069798.1 phospholipase D family protein [Limosilactobacillus albertensis]MCD7117676.1 phospholipase D family protein [Limosilactobacillus albertensis]MCD7129599.1 phospholipase D family protein [Limosilactobacillus albertensis]